MLTICKPIRKVCRNMSQLRNAPKNLSKPKVQKFSGKTAHRFFQCSERPTPQFRLNSVSIGGGAGLNSTLQITQTTLFSLPKHSSLKTPPPQRDPQHTLVVGHNLVRDLCLSHSNNEKPKRDPQRTLVVGRVVFQRPSLKQ